ncbi:4'-phosphopantetheinyl transferase family protein [Pedobacter terrae]|uniref:4'-phosphopantetheinyl transferase family protein n=1 Tax=Pedobacter terrae TaxID=405671 RepID=UPI00115F887C|nr:4'-phosphopantetheinyl transferase superfamily protein [Pedobacter terrae]
MNKFESTKGLEKMATVNIFLTKLDQNFKNSSLILSNLNRFPIFWQESILKKRDWISALSSMAGLLLLEKALSNMGLLRLINSIKISAYGKPYLDNGPAFNISHSGKYVACAVAEISSIGLDVEEIRDIEISEYREVFSPSEWRLIKDSKDWKSQFYRYWTTKEAVVKANGKGLHISLEEIRVENNKVVCEGISYSTYEIDVEFPDIILNLASHEKIDRFNIEYISFKELEKEMDLKEKLSKPNLDASF